MVNVYTYGYVYAYYKNNNFKVETVDTTLLKNADRTEFHGVSKNNLKRRALNDEIENILQGFR